MSKSDSRLGMGIDITRRDFIHDVGITALGMSLPFSSVAVSGKTVPDNYYPPTLTGLRGSHPGAFEAAHAMAREGKHFDAVSELDEIYDLVVVGAGISGLAAAQYYQKKFGKNSRILLLENHDDFGGHAKRNEFHQSGQMRLSLGGTHNLEHWKFSKIVRSMLDELDIDIETMLHSKEFQYGTNGKNGAAIWFDKETYGKNKLVTHCDLSGADPEALKIAIEKFPMSKKARKQLQRFYAMRSNILKDKNKKQAKIYLKGISYTDFLRNHGGLSNEAIQLFNNATHGADGVEVRCLSASEGLKSGLPGLHLLGHELPGEEGDYPVAMFPDGNASVARLLVQKLIPDVAPGSNANNIALATFDYSKLDQQNSPVRLRLNSTVVNASNTESGVSVSYINDGQTFGVKAKHCVMACYHMIIPHLCPDLPKEQKEAQKYQVKRPLLLTNVLIRSSQALDKLGISGARCPGRMHGHIFMFKGINTSGYNHKFADTGPVPLTFWGSISPPEDIVHVNDQCRASREKMLTLTFEDYEREVRSVLDNMLGPTGFDVKNDILAITVNRWPHGYALDYLDLWDPEWPDGEAPHNIASKPHGNISFANSDAGASAYTHTAIEQAFRAINELS